MIKLWVKLNMKRQILNVQVSGSTYNQSGYYVGNIFIVITSAEEFNKNSC
jgi:hypothetical protein